MLSKRDHYISIGDKLKAEREDMPNQEIRYKLYRVVLDDLCENLTNSRSLLVDGVKKVVMDIPRCVALELHAYYPDQRDLVNVSWNRK